MAAEDEVMRLRADVERLTRELGEARDERDVALARECVNGTACRIGRSRIRDAIYAAEYVRWCGMGTPHADAHLHATARADWWADASQVGR